MSTSPDQDRPPSDLHLDTLYFYLEQMRKSEKFRSDMEARMNRAWESLPAEERIIRGAIDELLYPNDPTKKQRSAEAYLLYQVIAEDLEQYDSMEPDLRISDAPSA